MQEVYSDHESDDSEQSSFWGSFRESAPFPIEGGDFGRVDPSSKVNFSKLSEQEKKDRFLNMAKMIKNLKARVRSLKVKIKMMRKSGSGKREFTFRDRVRPVKSLCRGPI